MQRCSSQLFASRAVREVDQDSFPLAQVVSEADWIDALEFFRRSYASLEGGLRGMTASALTDLSPSTAYGRTWTVRDHIPGLRFTAPIMQRRSCRCENGWAHGPSSHDRSVPRALAPRSEQRCRPTSSDGQRPE